MKQERKITTVNLALVLIHDLLLARGIEAGDGPIKQSILRHKTRLHAEFQKIKIKRGVTLNEQLALGGDERFGAVVHRPTACSSSNLLQHKFLAMYESTHALGASIVLSNHLLPVASVSGTHLRPSEFQN